MCIDVRYSEYGDGARKGRDDEKEGNLRNVLNEKEEEDENEE